MTDQYSIAEARHNLAALVRRLEKHPLIEITRRGKPVAVLMSLQEYQHLSAGQVGFWKAYSDFLSEVNLAELNIGTEVFEGVRSPEPGRSVIL
jgi:prevent-host-death family protein